ncbi:hypothetical protein ABZ815_19580 [Nonomuraea sp. NPDC047529]|uniref:hypothetical protein n=1 Tax=Nonomuraea sp. NPDC047529 TaxID=3155623 RepID=UPI0033D9B906
MRKDGGTYSTLAWSRSTDEGRTWSAVRDLQLSGQSCTVRGVAPRLLLMPNGVLVLSAGRPDNWLAISRTSSNSASSPVGAVPALLKA